MIVTDTNKLGLTPGTPRYNSLLGRPQPPGRHHRCASSTCTTAPGSRRSQAQVAGHATCPYAVNLVADADQGHRRTPTGNASSKYVVIAGGDDVIPFFRYPDTSGLGPGEPVLAAGAARTRPSDAQPRSRTRCSARTPTAPRHEVTIGGATVPVPDLAVGRLVEDAGGDRGHDRQLPRRSANGTPAAARPLSLVTGYDFLADAADAVNERVRRTRCPDGTADTLITDTGTPTTPETRGTATPLGDALLGQHHDLVYLAGHFSANDTLAADFDDHLRRRRARPRPVGRPDARSRTRWCSAPAATPATTSSTDAGSTTLHQPERLDPADGPAAGGADRRHGLPVRRHRLPRVQRAALPRRRPPAARGRPAATDARSPSAAPSCWPSRTTWPSLDHADGIDQKAVLAGHALRPADDRLRRARPQPAARRGLGTVDPDAVTTRSPVARSACDGRPDVRHRHARPRAVRRPRRRCRPADRARAGSTASDGVTVQPGAPGPAQAGRGRHRRRHTCCAASGFRGGVPTRTPTRAPPADRRAGDRGRRRPTSTFESDAFFPQRLATANYFGALGASGRTSLILTPAQYRTDATRRRPDQHRAGLPRPGPAALLHRRRRRRPRRATGPRWPRRRRSATSRAPCRQRPGDASRPGPPATRPPASSRCGSPGPGRADARARHVAVVRPGAGPERLDPLDRRRCRSRRPVARRDAVPRAGGQRRRRGRSRHRRRRRLRRGASRPTSRCRPGRPAHSTAPRSDAPRSASPPQVRAARRALLVAGPDRALHGARGDGQRSTRVSRRYIGRQRRLRQRCSPAAERDADRRSATCTVRRRALRPPTASSDSGRDRLTVVRTSRCHQRYHAADPRLADRPGGHAVALPAPVLATRSTDPAPRVVDVAGDVHRPRPAANGAGATFRAGLERHRDHRRERCGARPRHPSRRRPPTAGVVLR